MKTLSAERRNFVPDSGPPNLDKSRAKQKSDSREEERKIKNGTPPRTLTATGRRKRGPFEICPRARI
ncbi:hypothetical protein GWI33_008418 [Rhynchophorus ferrugineus]|uniref:Uncharacterized protein n=1 Tax=Rhynchophorus ferrugineus TaxID=354439 RepID=A0A834MHE1_RHYFE|nr:hypothetical protein GWI33_008418 [Rhynchophorus ferrugineus]